MREEETDGESKVTYSFLAFSVGLNSRRHKWVVGKAIPLWNMVGHRISILRVCDLVSCLTEHV